MAVSKAELILNKRFQIVPDVDGDLPVVDVVDDSVRRAERKARIEAAHKRLSALQIMLAEDEAVLRTLQSIENMSKNHC